MALVPVREPFGARWRRRAAWCAVALWGLVTALSPSVGRADTIAYSTPFSFTHTGTVSTGLVSVGGTFVNSVTTPSTLSFAKFDTALGQLTGVSVSVATSASTFSLTPTGLLGLTTAASATRSFGYTVVSGTAGNGDAASVASSPTALLTLLGLGAVEVGGAPLASTRTFTSAADLAQFGGSGTMSVNLAATDSLSVTVGVSLLNGSGLNGTGSYAGNVAVTYTYSPYVTLSGSVYKDADHDGFKSAAEAGTGLALYLKLVPDATPAGPALLAVAVDPTTGAWSMPVVRGTYRLLVDDNATLADVTPLVPPVGWSATQPASGLRSGVLVSASLAGQNFGLIPSTSVSGRLFNDDGAGAGTANDGIRNGGETGLAGSSVQLLDASNAVLDTATASTDGSYRLYVPASIAGGAALRVRQVLADTSLATAASLGNSGGTYTRTTTTVALGYVAGAAVSGLDFGSVAVPALVATGNQAGAPGSVLFYSHRFTATSSGQVSFGASHVSTPATAGWTEAVYVDANQNGAIDAGELPVSAAVPVVAGQVVYLVVKVSIPGSAPVGVRVQGTLSASVAFTNAAPALTRVVTVLESTDVISPGSASLQLRKAVDKATALPGDSLVYAITFTNSGASALTNVVISDATPAWTTFVSSTPTTLPAAIGTPVAVTPAVGASGPLRWTFPGQLAPNASGTIQFTVMVAP